MVLEVKECCAIVCVFEFTEVSEKDGSSFPKAHCTVCSCLLCVCVQLAGLDLTVI